MHRSTFLLWPGALLLSFLFSRVAYATSPETLALANAPQGAPNIVVVLLDDVGFGAAATFGGPVQTPAMDALASAGLRYNRFHTTAICSPTRASLLTGRDAHAANVGAVLNSANAYPGYQGILKKDTATIARVLQKEGYATGAFGKWHLAPVWETSPAGPFDRWPAGVGFDTFYGFLGGETDQFEPVLYQGTTPVMRPAGDNYHFTEDMTDRAISWFESQKSIRPDRPFFLYYATGAAHAPLHAPADWINQYKGKFSGGWDALRETIFERQKRLGVIPAAAKLTARPEQLPAWDSLSAQQRQVAERLMEAYAGFLAHTDAQVGRLVQSLQKNGEFDNTLFFYVVGDNGSSAEGGITGSINYMGALQGLREPLAARVAKLDAIGGRDSYPQYNAGWAWSLSTPFKWVKQVASHFGGSRNPLIVSWPNKLKRAGELREQFAHVNDITPTILDVLGLSLPKRVDGVLQKPLDGKSLLPSMLDARAPEHKTTQFFEVHGHAAVYHQGWMLSAMHDRLPWTVGLPRIASGPHKQHWELYNLQEDFTQADDLAARMPKKLAEMEAVFNLEAKRLGVYPIRSSLENPTAMPSLTGGATSFNYSGDVYAIPEAAAPAMANRSWRLSASVKPGLNGAKPGGVIATIGGSAGGWSLYIDKKGRAVFDCKVFELAQARIRTKSRLKPVQQQISLQFDYDGDGYAKGGEFVLVVDGKPVGSARVPATPPAFYSIDETFDLGRDTGSPAGRYPTSAPPGYPLRGFNIESVKIDLL
ncbi:MAG: arylsulfatase [Gammaproteobacteria bacterium]|nr:arylsulfatase [Gammaproteobacteria bacterium]